MPPPSIPSVAEVRGLLLASIGRFLESDDVYLLHIGGSERSVAHRLAVHLEVAFEGWSVDCEYNRVGNLQKLLSPPPETIYWADDEAKTVFPDIVVHWRGRKGPNILVVEMKKAGQRGAGFDREKLQAFTGKPLSYLVGAFLEFSTGPEGKFLEPQWFGSGP